MNYDEKTAENTVKLAEDFWSKGYVMAINPSCRTLDWKQAANLARKHKVGNSYFESAGPNGRHVDSIDATYWISPIANGNLYSIVRTERSY